MPRFFVKNEQIKELRAEIFGDDARHIARSLRMREGDEVSLCDEDGGEYRATLTKIRDELCELDIIEKVDTDAEPPYSLTLFMAYPKGDKLELVVQKATELGAHRIVPFYSSRCIKRPHPDSLEKQTKRLSRIAEEAAKQSRRSKIPTVECGVDFSEVCAEAKGFDAALFCYEGASADSTVKRALSGKPQKIAVVIGSEGGFSPEEAELAQKSGFVPVSLGKRILRCETAPIFALSVISYELEL